MNTHDLDTTRRLPEHDPALQALDQRLKRQLPLPAPPGLATDVFRATVGDLPERRVVAHLGWTSWTGWKYAAAIGLVFFYAALWARPSMMAMRLSDQTLQAVNFAIQPPSHDLDETIEGVAAEVDSFEPTVDLAALDEDDTLTLELIELDAEFGTKLF